MTVSLNGTSGIVFNDASTQNTSAFTGGFAMRNRIINGAMVIDQRNAGASISITTAAPFPVDRFNATIAQGSGHTAQRSTSAPTGFINSLLVTVGTGASASAGNVSRLFQQIEGLNVADLNWGATAASAGQTAATITLSFWVKSSLTGTFAGGIYNDAANRTYVFTYTISAANTWEQKSVTIAGDTSGTWLTTNGAGMVVNWDLGTGSTYQGTAGVWAAGAAWATSGSVKLAATSGATWSVTGVQLEKGSTATSFDVRPYTTELQLCQRYFETLGVFVSTSAWATIVNSAAPKVVKRATPTLSVTNFGAGSGAVFTWSAPSVGDAGGGIAYQTTGNSANAAATLQISIEL